MAKGNTKDPWPLGTQLKKARGRMSIRQAARRAGISESRWRQVEAGYQRVAGSIDAPVNPKPETVSAMARAVDADVAKALRAAGHNPRHYQWLVEGGGPEGWPEEVLRWYDRLPRADQDKFQDDMQRRTADQSLREAQ